MSFIWFLNGTWKLKKVFLGGFLWEVENCKNFAETILRGGYQLFNMGFLIVDTMEKESYKSKQHAQRKRPKYLKSQQLASWQLAEA